MCSMIVILSIGRAENINDTGRMQKAVVHKKLDIRLTLQRKLTISRLYIVALMQ